MYAASSGNVLEQTGKGVIKCRCRPKVPRTQRGFAPMAQVEHGARKPAINAARAPLAPQHQGGCHNTRCRTKGVLVGGSGSFGGLSCPDPCRPTCHWRHNGPGYYTRRVRVDSRHPDLAWVGVGLLWQAATPFPCLWATTGQSYAIQPYGLLSTAAPIPALTEQPKPAAHMATETERMAG